MCYYALAAGLIIKKVQPSQLTSPPVFVSAEQVQPSWRRAGFWNGYEHTLSLSSYLL